VAEVLNKFGRVFFGALIILAVFQSKSLVAESGMPMAKPPTDSRQQSYDPLRHQLTALEMAARFQISIERVFKELADTKLSQPLDPLRDREAYYRSNIYTQSPRAMARSLGISPAQVFYELRLLHLSLASYLLDSLPTSVLEEVSRETKAQSGPGRIQFASGTNRWTILQVTLRKQQLDPLSLSSLLKLSPELIDSLKEVAGWQSGMPASVWDQTLVFKAEARIRSELLIELASLSYNLSEISEILNRNTPSSHSAHLLPKMIEDRIRQMQISITPPPALNAKTLLPTQLSNLDRETFALKKLFEFSRSQKRLPQKQDFFREENKEPQVNLRYSEFVLAFGTQSRAWLQAKQRQADFEKWMGRLSPVRLLDVDFENDPGDKVRKEWQREVIAELTNRLPNTATALPSREMILSWVGVPYEALNAAEAYSFGGSLYGLRVFDNHDHFQQSLQNAFPHLELPKIEARRINSQESN